MAPAYARLLLGKKPYSAPEDTVIEPVELKARTVKLSATHLQRYRDVCAVPASDARSIPNARDSSSPPTCRKGFVAHCLRHVVLIRLLHR